MKNDDWIMVYKTEPMENNVAEFSSKDEFIHDAKLYYLSDNFEDESAYEEAGNQIIIKIKKDCGLRCVRVENPGEGTGVKLVRI